MTIEEAIKHCEEIAQENEKQFDGCPMKYDGAYANNGKSAYKCAAEHRQLAEWLKDYKRLLEQEPCGKDIYVPATDAISRQAVLVAIDAEAWAFCDYLINAGRNDEQKPVSHFADNLRDRIMNELLSVTPARPKSEWIPVKWHEVTKEETEHENCMSWIDYPLQGEEHWFIFENPMPKNEQEILVCMAGDYIEVDCAFKDDEYGWGLDIHDWKDVLAWMPLPEPYKAESEVQDAK